MPLFLFCLLLQLSSLPVLTKAIRGSFPTRPVSGDSGIVSDAEQGFPLEKKFFDGTEITVLCVGRHTYGEMQFVSDDEIVANVVNDAVAMRNDLIEEEYGLKIRTVAEDYPVEKLRLCGQFRS